MDYESRIEYLKMLQDTISRMSTASALFKGFSATIVSGIAMLSINTVRLDVMILSFIPVIVFNALDIYYLMIERSYRYIYERVRKGEVPFDFQLEISKHRIDKRVAQSRPVDCMLSPSILLFYPIMIGILIIVVVIKCGV